MNLLLAITDDDLAPATIAVAEALHKRRNAKPSAVYVIEIGPSVPEAGIIVAQFEEELRNPQALAKQVDEMRPVLHLDSGAKATWPFEIVAGAVGREIVEAARKKGSDLIVMGLNRHAAMSRAIGNDTAREVMAIAGVPVLAVRPQLAGLPASVVIAVDFSRASIRAARLACQIVDDNCSVHLLFIESDSPRETTESVEGLQLIRSKGVDEAFRDLIHALDPPAGMRIDTKVRRGKPVEEITRFCEEIEPDLVAVGSQHHRFLDRLLLGSVARSIAAEGRWSMLVTPPERGDHTPPSGVSVNGRVIL